MNCSQQTFRQIERALRKVSSKFPADAESLPLTDFHLQVKPESGELLVFDDDDHEITRCVIEEWIGQSADNFYPTAQAQLTEAFEALRPVVDDVAVLRPFSYTLIGEDRETIAELHYVDDDERIVISGPLLEGLDEDLEAFWDELSKR